MLKRALVAFAASLFISSICLAQDSRFDFSMNANALFTKQTSGNGITQTATDGWGGFGSIRARFNPKHSVVFSYGREKNSQLYQTVDTFHILDNISEYSFAYMFTPMTKGHWEPFLLGGIGALRFSPRTEWIFLPPLPGNVPDNIQVNLPAATQTQLAYVYGGGVDYRLPVFSRFAIRFQYRGFIYKAPDFKIDASSGSNLSFFTGARGHMAEPSIGLVFRF